MQVSVAGHSFIRRMVFNMHQHGLTLGTESYTVDTIGIGGATIVGHKPIFSHIRHQAELQKYNLLVVDVGSNDLDLTRNPNINIIQLARELVTQAQEIGLHFDLKVVICLPIPRAESKFPGLFDITMAFNDQVKTMARNRENVKV